MKPAVNIFWFRRDLRLNDNTGLNHALQEGRPIVPIFIFDRNILDELEDRSDRRVEFIYKAIEKIQGALVKRGSTLHVRYGFPEQVFRQLMAKFHIEKVFANHDYEPYATERDKSIARLLKDKGISFHSFKDQVMFEKDEVIKDDGKPYIVFTPYSRKWKARLDSSNAQSRSGKKNVPAFYKQPAARIPSLKSMGFIASGRPFPSSTLKEKLIKNYAGQRDFPAIAGTSRLSIHLRFGTISIRKLVKEAALVSETFLNELIWREFYQMILWQFPHVVDHSFKAAYDKIRWRNDQKEYEAWCHGQTGYPIVDAGMRELNETGFMHNRVRMITASFLTKHLLIDWRWGEAYFAKKLLDYDLASNNGGWQWAAGTGCDAAPYFRVFNPYLQAKKFDPELKYIRQWVPEFEEDGYPAPIVEHEFARKRCLETYRRALRE